MSLEIVIENRLIPLNGADQFDITEILEPIGTDPGGLIVFPNYLRLGVTTPATTKVEVLFYMTEWEDENDLDPDGDPKFIKKKTFAFDADGLPPPNRTEILATGRTEIPFGLLEAAIKLKVGAPGLRLAMAMRGSSA